MDKTNHRFDFVNKPKPPPNWEKNNMAFMLCNISLPQGTQLPNRLINYILEFIPESFDPPHPPSPPPPHLPYVIIDNYSNIWTKCCECTNRVCISVPDDWYELISCTLPNGDITSAICYSCEEDLRFREEEEEFVNNMFSVSDFCEFCGREICSCDYHDDSSDY
jgi:hypothetical protein